LAAKGRQTKASKEEREDIHQNARFTPRRREELAGSVLTCALTRAEAAERFGVSTTTVRKWVRRFEVEGKGGMGDRLSRPVRVPSQIAVSMVAAISVLRWQRLTAR
jgi:transposase-like protein